MKQKEEISKLTERIDLKTNYLGNKDSITENSLSKTSPRYFTQEDRCYMDRNPEHFVIILDYLKKISPS